MQVEPQPAVLRNISLEINMETARLQRKSESEWHIEPRGKMRVPAVIYATEAELDQDLTASIVAISVCIGFAVLPFLPRLAMLVAG